MMLAPEYAIENKVGWQLSKPELLNLEISAKCVDHVDGDIEALVRFGFVKQYTTNTDCTTPFIMVHREMDVVVKRPYLYRVSCVSFDPLFIPQYAVKTIIRQYRYSDYHQTFPGDVYPVIFIQPLVDVSDFAQMTAYTMLRDVVNYDSFPIDFASRNIGLYKNQPVIFDW